MDSIILFGNEDAQLVKILEKLGYHTTAHSQAEGLADLVARSHPDVLVIDGRFDFDVIELLSFLRDQETTKQVPVVLLAKDRLMQLKAAELQLDRLEILSLPYRTGTLVSKIATQMRLRKFNGADPEKASIGEINARLRELNDCFTRQLQEAREIQMGLVPQKLPKDDRYGIAVAYEPLEEVGGDWYYVQQENDGQLRVHIADVTGHGLSAAFVGCMTKLAMHAAGNRDPRDQLMIMNRFMAACIPAEKFVTMFSYLYDPATGLLKMVCAGHPPALILKRQERRVVQVKSSGFAIGFFDEAEYKQEEIQLDHGDIALIFTDALPESQNMNSVVYGYEQMENVLLESNPELSASKVLQSVFQDFDKFRDGRILKDDVTAIVLKREK